jgi:hypothetical protein
MSGRRPYPDNIAHLRDELRRLDLLIRLRIAESALQNALVPEAQAGRAVYITAEEVNWLLAADGGAAPGGAAAGAARAQAEELRADLARLSAEIDGRVARSLDDGVHLALPVLGQLFGLSPVELRAVVVCLAPELRRKYDRLYAYLQDDITRKRPSVDLVLDLACETEEERWRARGRFADTAPLLRAGLLRAVDDPQSPSGSSGLAQYLALDPRICRFLLAGGMGAEDTGEPDSRLAGRSRLHRPGDGAAHDTAYGAGNGAAEPVAAGIADRALRLVRHHHTPGAARRRPLVLYLQGPAGVGKRALVLRVCGQLGVPLLTVDVEALPGSRAEAEELLRLAFREALLQGAATHLSGADALAAEGARPLLRSMAATVTEHGGLVFLSGESHWSAADAFPGAIFHPVALPVPDVPVRTAVWRRYLAGRTADPGEWAAQLGARFRLTPGRIRAAVEAADNDRLMGTARGELTLADVAAACRRQSNQRLAALALKIEPRRGWEDLVLPADKVDHLREICSQARHHYRVYGAWGFGARLGHGKGLSVLFSGPPGTGKTMAAEVVAHDLGLDLYKVDLSAVVSKYIGETEKNLARIFTEAETSNAILFFDEADALFGKRTEVSHAHDRFANIETSYLLQKMEEYEGIVVLATNLRQNLDEAFTRRIRFIVEFPFPEEESRMRIWSTLFPAESPVSADVDYAYLARQFPVAGGSIKNIALNAAFLAAADGGTIGTRHILQCTRREFEKIGKLWTEPIPPGEPARSTAGGG